MTDPNLAETIRQALQNVEVPGGGRLSDFEGLSEIIVTPSAVAFAISVEPGMEGAFGPVRAQATEAIAGIVEGRKILLSVTSDRAGAAQGKPRVPRAESKPKPQPVKGIKHIIAVASGKGGVGKSTFAVNLALALKARGLKVGILDADLYGPSIPKLLALEGKPAVRDDGIFTPFQAFGLEAMSIGPMLEADQAVVWRGPMASSALRQLLRETNWNDLDVLVVDLPPGTGDIQISLCQQVELTGAIIISTPQDLALIDAKKAMNMFQRLQIPILGMVENMSYFIAPDTGNRYDIFGHGGAKSTAESIGIEFYGEIPLHMAIREQSDSGSPIVASYPDGPEAAAFGQIADRLISSVPALVQK